MLRWSIPRCAAVAVCAALAFAPAPAFAADAPAEESVFAPVAAPDPAGLLPDPQPGGPSAVGSSRVGPLLATLIGKQAFIYGIPLREFLRTRAEMTAVTCPDDQGNAPINVLSNVSNFANSTATAVVAPNVDTLYSITQLDLGEGPVVLEHPNMGSRYFSFQLADPYTNTVGYIGSRTTGSSAGRFAIRWKGARGTAPERARVIDVDHRRIWVIGRTFATGPADLPAARRLMQQYKLTPPGGTPRVEECNTPPPVAAAAPTGIDFLEQLNRDLAENPPPDRDSAVLKWLALIGVGPGLSVDQAGLSPAARKALDESVRNLQGNWPSLVSVLQRLGSLQGWSGVPAKLGNYGTDYALRAIVAQVGLGANTPEEAAYMTAQNDSSRQPLDGNNSYRLRFGRGQEPKTDGTFGFWSVTVYNEQGFLVDVPGAPKGTYSVGNRRVPGLVRRRDGSVEIVFSHTKPRDRNVNWLPVPKGRFLAYLRVYTPDKQVYDGRWTPPTIQRLLRTP